MRKARYLLVVLAVVSVVAAFAVLRAGGHRGTPPKPRLVPVELGLVVQPTIPHQQGGKVLLLEFAPIDECYAEYDIERIDVKESKSEVVLAAWGRAGSSHAHADCDEDEWKYESVVLDHPLGDRALVDDNCGARGGSKKPCSLPTLPAAIVKSAAHHERLFARPAISVAL